MAIRRIRLVMTAGAFIGAVAEGEPSTALSRPPHRSLASPTLSARRRPPGSQSTLLPGSPSSLPRPRTASLLHRRSPSPSPRRPSPSVHPDRRRAVYAHAVKPSTPVATVDPYAPSPVTMEPPPPFAARTRLLPSVGPPPTAPVGLLSLSRTYSPCSLPPRALDFPTRSIRVSLARRASMREAVSKERAEVGAAASARSRAGCSGAGATVCF